MTLALLQRSRAILEHFAPGFDALLGEIPFAAREAADSPVVGWFKHHGPVGLLINQEAGGLGADAFQAVHVQLALGARSPSLAVASTMHQFSVASLVAIGQNGAGAEGLLLSAIARQRLLLASGFAEGVPGGGILDAGMQAEQTPSGVILSGSKKPCSLGKSMDLLTASYSRISPAGEELMVALIPASAPGISHQPFWQNSALAAAESVEVRLDRVLVDNKMVFSAGLKTQLGEVQTIGFIWFELLISASYLGACLGLVEAVVAQQRWSEHHRVELAAQMQLCLSALEGAALDIQRHPDDLSAILARLLLVRYGIEQLLASTSDQAHQMLGGLDFIRSTDSSQWMLSCRGLQFHPPAKIAMSKNLDAYLQDASFSIAKGVAA
ncbi:acyl-CoA/acyl-ACP dehydrogenase [Pseudomonas donghuensis]|uniref:Acyl-CoA/acyl-ACP dehydrogenase n=1 Tax=Pseudomonas donghuensis TaxID=1163398 RepID=A0AAP0X9B5_9PSED|nr:acyl-CoA/acyl-ACP dehydrogenase [Pseudomonas donghuensis]MDF9894816.1 alkylation response protein AidB-like acyl-CoA dehydrogenase [Pseudomonas vranovensis]KDN97934.1 acyl-CoA/acyl-ACP dehydrogenase [Pseudomonas donghuensis]MBF4208461.1 acyl-CoA dehydrogenase [Pseudomonas donghuensis]MCP6693002.1 acyl-CoA/acyl-ACP dehydrogenase [Pseudomonas donghuensis]PJY97956.1 acyl-CoA dehydrogenase [Pseudomonas donghuensis]